MKVFLNLGTICVLFLSAAVCIADTADVLELVGNGHINWTSGIVQATGHIQPEEQGNPQPDNQLDDIFFDRARLEALKNILELAHLIRIDATSLVSDFVRHDTSHQQKIVHMVESSETVLQRKSDDGCFEVTVQMPLFGGFAQYVLPPDIRQVITIKSLSPVSPVDDSKNMSATGEKSESQAVPYTGLVVDAGGLGVIPAMSPVVYDEDGKEVFGPAFISREYAVQKGVCAYVNTLAATSGHDRVGESPLVVKGLRIRGPGVSDIVISNTDAGRIRSTSEHLSLLRECRVLIVLD